MNYSEFFISENTGKDFEICDEGCKVCSLTNRYSNDNETKNTCKFCGVHETNDYYGKEKFISDVALETNEKIGITVSGGKDSIYMWAKLTEMFGADRIVAFNHKKNGLVHPYATKNIEEAHKILGGELIVVQDNTMRNRFEKNLQMLLDSPEAGLVRVVLCAGCRYGITEELYSVGRNKGIKKYVSAASYLELAPFKEELLKEAGDGNLNNGLEKLLELHPEYDYNDNLEYIRKDNDYKYKGGVSNGKETLFNGSRLFDFDNYFPNIPLEIEEYVVRNLNWKRPERSWHFDCQVEEIKDIFYYGLLGYTETDFKLSSMVRHDLITKEEAIRQRSIIRWKIANSLDNTLELLRSLGLDYLNEKMKLFYKKSIYLNN